MAVIPALLMWVAVSAAIYLARLNEIRSDIQDRGRLLAATLAEASRYAVVSGNAPALSAVIHGLLATERSIAAVEVLDDTRQRIAEARTAEDHSGALPFEHPIQALAIDVDMFDDPAAPHLTGAGRDLQVKAGDVLGHVRVLMSPEPLLEAKRRNLYLAGLVTLVAAIVSGVVALLLARRIHGPLSAVMAALRDIREGRYQLRLPASRGGELGELQEAIVAMAGELAESRQALEAKVARRTEELQRALQAAREAEDEKRRLLAHGNALVEEERRRIAIEIHDQLNASLIAVRLGAAALCSHGDTPVPQAEVEAIAQRITKTADQLYDSARRIVKELRPEVLDTLGFRGAVAEAVRDFDTLHPGCRFELIVDERFPNLPHPLAINAYRIVQEALSNIAKHAGATAASVCLAVDEQRGALIMAASDNGRGLQPAWNQGSGLGLIGIRERALAAGGTLSVETLPSGGTRLEVRFPWPSGGGA
ncbi:sensor histidine kinase [Caldimonas brevitalea]|uniref:sensor histidine kinase n=1 Tax=Caldimonas brevitalea TaxID=413882 RepID=UPI0012FA8CA7|nr:histidine kinase [Caldimonas brevitalea]